MFKFTGMPRYNSNLSPSIIIRFRKFCQLVHFSKVKPLGCRGTNANQHPFQLFVTDILQYTKIVHKFWISNWIKYGPLF